MTETISPAESQAADSPRLPRPHTDAAALRAIEDATAHVRERALKITGQLRQQGHAGPAAPHPGLRGPDPGQGRSETRGRLMDRSRLEAFSDGVFAVAITLLALDLTVEGPGHGSLLDQLYDKWPAFLAYLISFFMIGIVWVNHHALVRSITKVDRLLLFLNLVLLLFVVLIPFATATEADYFPANDHDGQLAMVLYAGVFLGMSIGFGAIFEWTLHGERVYQPVPRERHWAARARFVGGGLVYVVAVIVATFNAVAAFVLIALVAVYYIVENTPASPGPDRSADDQPVA